MRPLKVAIVGAGAAGLYAVHHLLEQTAFDVEIDLIERLPTPWGLIRTGVAPDHPEKKQVTDRLFQFYLKDPRVRLLANLQVGTDVSHEELAGRYHAVIYAVGADDDRALGIAGEDLPGSWSARQFVAWYNGHPDARHLRFDFSGTHAVIVGTGNVALDVARILTLPVSELAKTDIADHALDALRDSQIRDVTLLGRRGCRQASFHNPELEEFLHLDAVEVRTEADDLDLPADTQCDWETRRKLATLARLQARQLAGAPKRITFKFHHTPLAVAGEDRVAGLDVRIDGAREGAERLPCGLLLRAIGYRGTALPGLPFDERAGVVTNAEGRVTDNGRSVDGVYVTGWIKRGPRGVIGSNKQCAAETVSRLLEDAAAGKLKHPAQDDIALLAEGRGARVIRQGGWEHIDAVERRAGVAAGRPRVKLTAIDALLATASNGRPREPDAAVGLAPRRDS
jgi:ferredoxin/flavodoxin---NADP+ reductase